MKKLFILIFLSILASAHVVAQCPMCKASVESNMENNEDAAVGVIGSANGNGGDPATGQGLNSGILYLMAAPYLMVGIIGVFWYKSKKKQERNAPSFG